MREDVQETCTDALSVLHAYAGLNVSRTFCIRRINGVVPQTDREWISLFGEFL